MFSILANFVILSYKGMKNSVLLPLFAVIFILAASCTKDRPLPDTITPGSFDAGHVQGIALDRQNGYMYFSFTTLLVKCDLEGNVVGTVKGLLGHLGCLAFNPGDGRLYGSLEYKHDSIGKGILKKQGVEDLQLGEGFYIAIFDCGRIDRMDMDAQADGVMTTVYLAEVYADYSGSGLDTLGLERPHRYGCSGIDGVGFGPAFCSGENPDERLLTVAYGIYGELDRNDNDNQVLLQYNISDWKRYERPLAQGNLHKSGPAAPDGKFFVPTGNTTWGVQNLEYDTYSGCWYMAVYKGRKPQNPNWSHFKVSRDLSFEGFNYEYGSTGMISLGDGSFYVSQPSSSEEGQSTTVVRLPDFDAVLRGDVH